MTDALAQAGGEAGRALAAHAPLVREPWHGVAILAGLLLAMLVALGWLRARRRIHPELTRKLAHVGLGLATLSFPWLFASVWPVAVIGLLATAVLLAVKHVPAIRERLGGVVHGVKRESRGDVYFPVAAVALFALSGGDPILFGVPVLTLTVADAVAALVGLRYGRTRYATADGRKSLEGSVAFFTTAFLAAHVPLLLLTDVGRAESLLIGLTFGLLVMLLEAVAWRGLDNLFIPLGGYLLLRAQLAEPAAALGLKLVVTLALLGIALALRTRRTLSDTAVLAGVLIGFVSWSAGGWRWLVPPLVVFLSYTVLWPRSEQLRERPHDLVAVFGVAASGLVWLFVATVLRDPRLYYPYTLAFAANLAFIGITWFHVARPELSAARAVGAAGLVAWGALFGPYLVITGAEPGALVTATVAIVPILAAGAAYRALVPHRPGATSREHPWLRQAVIGLVASALGVLVPLPSRLAPPL